MSDREEEPLEGREPACLLCQQSEADLDICGEQLQINGFCAHEFCLFFTSHLPQHNDDPVGLFGFLPRDIQDVVSREAQKSCCICGQSGATIPQIHPADPEVTVRGAVSEHPVLGAPLTGGTVRQGPTADTSHVRQGGGAPRREGAR
ncbi:PHD finger protein 7-like [Corapipo altera]|uniref:PHD finger protein 7-like n=1 Tax=Corapipo altera TaxID=415028 RepID=UPI000FD6899A|nr:PHD finger protein 7-like [Corapipo altera]XP_027488350.1 PHD finger protein 7-like [Corapipo altera]